MQVNRDSDLAKLTVISTLRGFKRVNQRDTYESVPSSSESSSGNINRFNSGEKKNLNLAASSVVAPLPATLSSEPS